MNFFYLTIFLISFLCSSCGENTTKAEINNITVSILPLKYFVEQIGDNDFNVNVMVPPGASPETFEPTTTQMKQLANSKTFFTLNLLEFEVAYSKMIQQNFNDVDYVVLTDSLKLMRHNHNCEHSHGIDPHIWLSFENSKILAKQISKRLCKLKPQNKLTYNQRTTDLISRICELQDSASKYIKPGESFIIYHPSLSYLSEELGLNQIAVEDDGKEPSAANIKSLIDRSLQDSVKVVLYQKQIGEYAIYSISDALGITPTEFDPLAYDWENNMKQIINLLMR